MNVLRLVFMMLPNQAALEATRALMDAPSARPYQTVPIA
jgi:hypothetical protein